MHEHITLTCSLRVVWAHSIQQTTFISNFFPIFTWSLCHLNLAPLYSSSQCFCIAFNPLSQSLKFMGSPAIPTNSCNLTSFHIKIYLEALPNPGKSNETYWNEILSATAKWGATRLWVIPQQEIKHVLWVYKLMSMLVDLRRANSLASIF